MSAPPDTETGTDTPEATPTTGTLIDALYRRYHQMLRRFLARRQVHHDEIPDIVQETYWRVLNAGDAQNIRHPGAFLRQVAGRVLLNQRKRQRASVEDLAADIDSAEVEADEPSAYRHLKGEQECALVQSALEELAPKCRAVFVMNRFESMSYAQISAELDISVSMIEKYVSQALAYLRGRLADSAAVVPISQAKSTRPSSARS